MKKYSFTVILLFISMGVFADILLLTELDPVTGQGRIVEGKIKKKQGIYTVRTESGDEMTFSEDKVVKKFNSRDKYEEYIGDADYSYQKLQLLEAEAERLRHLYKEITSDTFITIRHSPGSGFEFYQFGRRLDTRKDMTRALKDYRIALKEYEELHTVYRRGTNTAVVGITLSALSGLAAVVIGSYALGTNYAPDLPGGFDLELSNTGSIIASAVAGGVFLTGTALTIGGISFRLHARGQFVLPVEKYNSYMERQNNASGNSGVKAELSVVFPL